MTLVPFVVTVEADFGEIKGAPVECASGVDTVHFNASRGVSDNASVPHRISEALLRQHR